MQVHINAARCIEYLRRVGIVVSDEQAADWTSMEANYRQAQRAGRRERKKSCGHFNTHWTRIVHKGGRTDVQYCSDCSTSLAYRGDSL